MIYILPAARWHDRNTKGAPGEHLVTALGSQDHPRTHWDWAEMAQSPTKGKVLGRSQGTGRELPETLPWGRTGLASYPHMWVPPPQAARQRCRPRVFWGRLRGTLCLGRVQMPRKTRGPVSPTLCTSVRGLQRQMPPFRRPCPGCRGPSIALPGLSCQPQPSGHHAWAPRQAWPLLSPLTVPGTQAWDELPA